MFRRDNTPLVILNIAYTLVADAASMCVEKTRRIKNSATVCRDDSHDTVQSKSRHHTPGNTRGNLESFYRNYDMTWTYPLYYRVFVPGYHYYNFRIVGN